MSLDVYIIYDKPKKANYFIDHPYSYDYLSDKDLNDYSEKEYWTANITHNLGKMADHVPVSFIDKDNKVVQTTLYMVCWRPEEIGLKTTTDILDPLEEGIIYMIKNRLRLLEYESPNGWGTYNGFMKFLLNYKQACEDNIDCEIEVSR